MIGDHGPAIKSLPPTVKDKMQVIFVSLLFCQMVTKNLLKKQGVGSPRTFVSISYNDIIAISDVIRRKGDLVSENMPEKGIKIFILVAKNLKLATFMLKMMKYCSKPNEILLQVL